MKKKVKQGESILCKGIWYNQGEEYEDEKDAPEVKPESDKKKLNEKEKEG